MPKRRNKSRRQTPWDAQQTLTATQEFIQMHYKAQYANRHHCLVIEVKHYFRFNDFTFSIFLPNDDYGCHKGTSAKTEAVPETIQQLNLLFRFSYLSIQNLDFTKMTFDT